MLSGAESERPSLVLASTSPRRRELLSRLGLTFTVEPADIDETPRSGESASDLVVRLASGKAQTIARPGMVVVAADTEVALDDRSLGKPLDAEDAASMLRRLSGRQHEAMTGFAVAADGRVETGIARTIVFVRELSEADIAWYVATGEPMGKAGAYAIQGKGSVFIDRIEGSHDAVVGLPLATLDVVMADMGYSLRSFVTQTVTLEGSGLAQQTVRQSEREASRQQQSGAQQ